MTLTKYLIAFVLAGCAASSANKQPAASDPNSATTEPAAVPGPVPQCLADDGSQAECTDDRDCCAGYYCGKDPEGNNRKRFCLYAGGH